MYLFLFTLCCPVQMCQRREMDFLCLTVQTHFFLLPRRGPTIPAQSHRNPKVPSASSSLCLFILSDFPPHLAALTPYSIVWQICIEFRPCAQPCASPLPSFQRKMMLGHGCWSSGAQRLMGKQVNKQLQSARYTPCHRETGGGMQVSPF